MSGKECDIFKLDYARMRDCLRDISAKYRVNKIAAESNLGKIEFFQENRIITPPFSKIFQEF